jgi:hypothetical protein
MARVKELNFFIAERNWPKGLDWYTAQFSGKTPVRGEASPNYTILSVFGGVAERMHSVLPDARLIYMVRDPIERMVSHYIHQYAEGKERRPAETALLTAGDNRYIACSSYHAQLEPYLRLFPRRNVLVLEAEDLDAHRDRTMSEVFEFLGVDPSFRSWRFRSVRHRSRYKRRKTPLGRRLAAGGVDRLLDFIPRDLRWHAQKLVYLPFSNAIPRPVLSEQTRMQLADRLRPDLECFRRVIGKGFERWGM